MNSVPRGRTQKRIDEKRIFKIFYAWQSDLPNRTNRGLIEDALKKAIASLNKDIEIEAADRESDVSSISLDRDTLGVPGSPDLAATIFEKIKEADLFVADVSFIGKSPDGKKLIPNPNVLIEVGQALAELGSDRVAMVLNTATGKIEELPFDIRHKRSIAYHAAVDSEDLTEQKKKLVGIFVEVIRPHLQQQQEVQQSIDVLMTCVVERQNLTPANNQYGFNIIISATNMVTTTLHDFELHAFIPRGLLADGTQDYQRPNLDTPTHRAFVFPKANQVQKLSLRPGKIERILNISCLLYPHNLGKIWITMEEKILIKVFGDDMKPQSHEFQVLQLNPYRLLKVDPNTLLFNKQYRLEDFPDAKITVVNKCSCH